MEACAQYEIPIIAYSPIGRGMLVGQCKKSDDLSQQPLLLSFNFPRFWRENFERNLGLIEKVEETAEKKGCAAVSWQSIEQEHSLDVPGC